MTATHFKDGNTAREWSGPAGPCGGKIKEIWYVKRRAESGGKEVAE